MKYGDTTWLKRNILEYEIDKLVRNFESEVEYEVIKIEVLRMNKDKRFASRIYIHSKGTGEKNDNI